MVGVRLTGPRSNHDSLVAKILPKGYPPNHPLRFAVVGRNETEAVERYYEALARWEAIPNEFVATVDA